MLSFLWIICGPPFVSYVEPFDYFGSQIHSCLQNRKEYLQQVLKFSQFIYAICLLQQSLKEFSVPRGCKGEMGSQKVIR